MSATDSTMENALLLIAKDLLQASDDLAATDPSASAKLAQEAYEIGRDLGIVRNHLDSKDEVDVSSLREMASMNGFAGTRAEQASSTNGAAADMNGFASSVGGHASSANGEGGERESLWVSHHDDSDDGLSRILDRQKSMLPTRIDVAPPRQPTQNGKPLTFESVPKRSGWFGWIRPREWRHAG
jgi:hypothetical protein